MQFNLLFTLPDCTVHKFYPLARALCQLKDSRTTIQDRVRTLKLATVKTRRSYLSVYFDSSGLSYASFLYFCRWFVKMRQKSLTVLLLNEALYQKGTPKHCLFFVVISLFCGHLSIAYLLPIHLQIWAENIFHGKKMFNFCHLL